jgi:MFS family permease
VTIPCYATGAIIYLVLARISDWKQIRGPIAATMGCVSAIGYGILLSRGSPAVLYLGCFVVAAGASIVQGLGIAWLNTNNPRYGKRAAASGTQIVVGNCAGIIAPFVSTAYMCILIDAPELY